MPMFFFMYRGKGEKKTKQKAIDNSRGKQEGESRLVLLENIDILILYELWNRWGSEIGMT